MHLKAKIRKIPVRFISFLNLKVFLPHEIFFKDFLVGTFEN